MKNLRFLLGFIFLLGLFVRSYNVQAQSSASDKEQTIEWVKIEMLKGLSEVRFFETPSGKEQYKIQGVYLGGTFELLININALGGKKAGTYNIIAKGVIYNAWGIPILVGSNKGIMDDPEEVIREGYFRVFIFKVQGLIIEMNWTPVFPI